MYCPKCGKEIVNGEKVCPNCGLDFSTVDSDTKGAQSEVSLKSENPYDQTELMTKNEQWKKVFNAKLLIFCVLALITIIMSFMAASNISDGGYQIMQIKSVGGQTLEEAYYQQLGSIYAGYAIFVRTCGIFFASVLVGLGLNRSKVK
ncbi:MAG: zinc-ribbon domain-containing protein [Oscillospiraceae bacterium]|nr:zinc-ribbon domain-containing protein [Oscillospiraceae bacterium]